MNTNFIYAKTKQLFLNQLTLGNISNEVIVFIEDTKEIWTNGTYFKCMSLDSSDICTSSDLNKSLLNKQDILQSGINIKTINSNNILGEGDIQVSGELSYDVKEALINCFNNVAWTNDQAPILIDNLKNSLNYIETPKYNLNEQGYIQDGLYLYFDGIDNTMNTDGSTQHTTSITQWHDLSGNGNNLYCYSNVLGTTSKTLNVGADNIYFDGSTYFFPSNPSTINNKFKVSVDGTLEIVFKETSGTHVSNIFCTLCGDNHNEIVKGLWYRPSSNSYICYYSNNAKSVKTGFASSRCTNISSISIGYSNSLTDKPLYIYLNNLLQTSSNAGGTMPSQATFAVGGRKHSTSTENGYCFKGNIYAIRYYDRVLNDEERLINYNNDKLRFSL